MLVRHRGILLFLLATFLFSIIDSISKHLVAHFSVPLLVWARHVVLLAILLIGVAPGMGRTIVLTRRPGLMVLRALLLVSVVVLVQLALRTLPLAETTALMFTSPLLVALLAGPVLGEKVRLTNWLATVVGFAGVLLIARPGDAIASTGVVYALGSALCYATYQLLTRKLSATEPPMRQLFYVALVGTVATSCFLPAYWTGEMPSAWHALLIVSLGVLGGTAHFLLIRAFRETPASVLSPLLYVQLLWATLLGWAIFGQLPDRLAAIGMLVIGLSGLSLVLLRTRRTVAAAG